VDGHGSEEVKEGGGAAAVEVAEAVAVAGLDGVEEGGGWCWVEGGGEVGYVGEEAGCPVLLMLVVFLFSLFLSFWIDG
jgi:hypothetical protein